LLVKPAFVEASLLLGPTKHIKNWIFTKTFESSSIVGRPQTTTTTTTSHGSPQSFDALISQFVIIDPPSLGILCLKGIAKTCWPTTKPKFGMENIQKNSPTRGLKH
jgi:hypothetical protein